MMDNKLKPIETLDELLVKQYPKTRWVVNEILPAEGITIISAAPCSFKTWLMLEVALAVAEGRGLFDKFETITTGVLLIDEESGPRMLQERFKKLNASNNLPIYYLSRTGKKITQQYVEELIEICGDNNIGLVMFDSLVRLHTGDENTSKDMSQLFDLFKHLADAGLSVLIAHHNRKAMPGNYNPTGDMRGSSDILAAVDCHLALNRQTNSDYITVQQTKNRYIREIRPFKLRFTETGDFSKFQFVSEIKSRGDERDDMKAAIIAILAHTPRLTKKGLHKELNRKGYEVGLSRTGALLEELILENLIEATPGVRNAIHYSVINDNGSALKTQ